MGSCASADESERAELLQHLERLRPGVIRPPSGMIRHPYCIPGGYYSQQWDWDGFFIAAHLAARRPARPEFLKFWTLNVLASEMPDGEVPACIAPEGPRHFQYSLLLKPFLAQAAELAGRLAGDDTWVGPLYPKLVRIATRRETTHRPGEYGLFVWRAAMESGIDDNPAVTNDPETARRRAACDANAYHYREYLALAGLAGRLGHYADQQRFTDEALTLHTAVNRFLWDPDACSYWNLDLAGHRHVKRVCCSNFLPLWAGMAPHDRGVAMIERYLWNEEHLLSPFGVRSLSRQDPDYHNRNLINPYSNWQGPVWPIANYFFFVALLNYGFRDEADELVRRLCRLMLDDIAGCGSLHENYHADSGVPLAPSAEQSATGTEGGFIGWNLLIQDMIEMLDGRPNLLELQP
jgi:alpha,alpha-trehalase